MSKPNRRQKQKKSERLRAELMGLLENPFGFSDSDDPELRREVEMIGAVMSRIYLPKSTIYPEVDIVLPTAHVTRLARQLHAQGLRVHPDLAKVALVIEDGNPRIAEVPA